MVVAGRLQAPCGTGGNSPVLDVFVPNNVELESVVSSPVSELDIDSTGLATLAVGASYDRILPPLQFSNDSSYSWNNLHLYHDMAEFGGSFKRLVFSRQVDSDGSVIAAMACELAKKYGVVEYGASLFDPSRCLRDDGEGCITDSQCTSGSKQSCLCFVEFCCVL